MIGIFHGRGIADTARVHAQIDVDLRNHIHEFNNGRNLNAFGLFMAIALHADENGWSYPSRAKLKQETGISTENALSAALAFLRLVKINGIRVFSHYRIRNEFTKAWGRSVYLIFPDLGVKDPPFEGLAEYDPVTFVKTPDGAGFVYLVKTDRGYKIGYSKRPSRRLKSIKSSHPTMELIAWYMASNAEDSEWEWHDVFKDKHQKGDWFNLDKNDIDVFRNGAFSVGGSADPIPNGLVVEDDAPEVHPKKLVQNPPPPPVAVNDEQPPQVPDLLNDNHIVGQGKPLNDDQYMGDQYTGNHALKEEPSLSLKRGETPDFDLISMREALALPEIQLFRKLTKFVPGEALWEPIWRAISENKFDEEYLIPFAREWIERGYRTNNIKWLTEWAVTGEIPQMGSRRRKSQNGNGSKPKHSGPQRRDPTPEELEQGRTAGLELLKQYQELTQQGA